MRKVELKPKGTAAIEMMTTVPFNFVLNDD